MIKFLLPLSFLTPLFSSEQILWSTEYESTSLNPNSIQTNFIIVIKNGNKTTRLNGDGIIRLDDQEIYFKSNNNYYRLEKNDIQSLITPYGEFTFKELFREGSIEKIRQIERSKVYLTLNLNKIKFSLSRKTSYEIVNESLKIKNEKILEGKICSISPYRIEIVESEGEMLSITDEDFNYLEFLGERYFNCANLYSKFYNSYPVQLDFTIKKWKEKFLGKDLETILEENGPFSNVIEISQEKKIFTWEKENRVINVDLNGGSSRVSFSNSNVRGESDQSLNGSRFMSSVLNIPSLFSYQTSFYNSNTRMNLFGNNTTVSTSSNYYSGQLVDLDKRIKLSLVFLSGKVIGVHHENIFSYPHYGMKFYFVNL